MSNKSPLHRIIDDKFPSLTAKGRLLGEFVLSNPDKAVFMTTRQLAAAVGTSEATVVRFVRQLGFESYAQFIATLRDVIDRELTLMERSALRQPLKRNEDNLLERLAGQDMENIKAMCKNQDPNTVDQVTQALKNASRVYVIGSRLSYSAAHYMSWTLSKIRDNVTLLQASDSTALDQMAFAPSGAVTVIIATSRYPNEMIRMGKVAHRQNMSQILITDGLSCPLIPFSDHVLLAPHQNIPFLGNPVSIISLIHYLLNHLTLELGDEIKVHQEKLEKAYMENDIWFN